MLGQRRMDFNAKPMHDQTYVSSIWPKASASKATVDVGAVNFLRGEVYRSQRQSEIPKEMPVAASLDLEANNWSSSIPSGTSSPHQRESIPSLFFTRQPNHFEPLQAVKTTEWLPSAPWEEVQTSGSLPPPPSKYNQRQQFFQQQQQKTLSGGASHANGSVSSYDRLVRRTHNLSLQQQDAHPSDAQESSTLVRLSKQEDKIFKDLVDFAKARSPSSAKPGSHKMY